MLFYGTGGLAWGDVDYHLNSPARAIGAHDDSTEIGWTAGGGLAWGITDRWTVGAEYLYVNFGEYSVGDNGFETQATPDFQSVKGYFNFRF